MTAFIIIFVCILFAFFLKAVDYFSNNRRIKSVGAKSNKESRNISKVDITKEEDLLLAMEHYKGLPD